MKTKSTLTFIAIMLIGLVNAQTADEIITNYFENTGGYEAWGKLEGFKIIAKVNQGGMEIPLEIVQLKSGKQYTKFSVQGTEFMQGVYDGESLWSINFQSLTAEKADTEALENHKLNINDFPDALYDYKAKNYPVELLGEESIEGTETFKIKLTKEPIIVDGEKVDDIVFYFFDKETFVLLAQEQEIHSGPMKGKINTTTFSDYDEVAGLYFPFSIIEGLKGGQTQPLVIESIEVNPTVEETVFAFPSGE